MAADQALPRLRGALPAGMVLIPIPHLIIGPIKWYLFFRTLADKSTHKALDEMSELFNYLRVWKLEKRVYVDALMPPTESYHRNLFFQVSVQLSLSLSCTLGLHQFHIRIWPLISYIKLLVLTGNLNFIHEHVNKHVLEHKWPKYGSVQAPLFYYMSFNVFFTPRIHAF